MDLPTSAAPIPAAGVPALQRALAEARLDAWLLYDFHGQNPTAVSAVGLEGHMLTRRWFYLVPAVGEAVALVHAIELGSFPEEIPGRRERYASWASLREALGRLLGTLPRGARVAMEYFPEGAIPYPVARRRGHARARARPRRGGGLLRQSSCSASCAAGTRRRSRATSARSLAIDAAKDAAFARIGEALRAGETLLETDVQRFLMERFAEADLETDHPPIVAVNGHAGDPHYEPSETDRRRRSGAGDLVLIDLWARGKGPRDVYADITWVAYCGDSPARAAPARSSASPPTRATSASPRSSGPTARGARCQGWEVDRAVRDHIAAAGLRRAVRPPHRPLHRHAPSTATARTSTTSRRTTRAGSCPGSASRSSPASTCRRRGSASGARSTCSSPTTGRRSSRRSSGSSCVIR